jgi:hypothetical protein
MSSDLEPLQRWFRPELPLAAALVREARAEIGANHELVGHELTAVVKCAEAAIDSHQH